MQLELIHHLLLRKTDLGTLKSNVDKLDIDNLVHAPVDLSKLSDVVKKWWCWRITSITNLGNNASLNAKANEVKNEKPNFTKLATTTALTAAENMIPNASKLVKKTGYNTEINKNEKKNTDYNHDKDISLPKFNKVTAEKFTARLKQAILESESDMTNFLKKTAFDNKLKDVTLNQNESNKLSKKVKGILTIDKIFDKYIQYS